MGRRMSSRFPDSVRLSSLVSPPLSTAQLPKQGGFMSKAFRTILSLAVGLMLFSAMTMAQAGGKNTEKDKNKQQHSRLGKVAFWRHHQDADKNAKPAKATQAPSKQPHAQARTAQAKPASAKQIAGNKDQKQEQHASNVSKPSTKKAPTAANKTKPQDDPKTALLKQ